MTTALEREELTRIGPATTMGELMRQYWIPAVLSLELARWRTAPPDAPRREADRVPR
jgi:hypothetical protein